MISPQTFRKRATRKELIALVNGRTNRVAGEAPYPEKSLSVKTAMHYPVPSPAVRNISLPVMMLLLREQGRIRVLFR